MDVRQQFRDLHRSPFVIPNPWDVGSARILASLGFPALATTSGGFANSLGRLDGRVTREEALAAVPYTPGIRTAADVRRIAAELDRPINALILPGGPTVRELFAAGATRVSTGSALAAAAQHALVEAARELQGPGTSEFWTR